MTVVGRLDHVSITVSDLDRSLGFYRDALGMREVERHRLEGEGISRMAAKPGVVLDVVRLAAGPSDDLLVDLQRYVAPEGGAVDGDLGDVGHAHICFVVDDMAAAVADLREHGAELVSEPVGFTLDSGSLHVVFVRDPDGFVVELVEYPTPSGSPAA
jgi:catechol 2,3-dioxygenase-like lactoylglutathione lyase family enzyme